MLTAFDKNKEIVFAENCSKEEVYHCRFCGEMLSLKKGEHNRPYFSHKPRTKCPFDDRDNKSEWHIRMQKYFPKEAIEYSFVDEKTNERHIADVFIKEKNTVIEFQKSRITDEEFRKRTDFHLSNNRRILWVFDESREKKLEGDLGRLRPDNEMCPRDFPYNHAVFQWLYNPRKCLIKGPRISFGINDPNYSVCFYSGAEGEDFLHRIVGEEYGYEYVTISVHVLSMNKDIDVDDFFRDEEYWFSQPDLKPIIDKHRNIEKLVKQAKEKEERDKINQIFNNLISPKRNNNRFRL